MCLRGQKVLNPRLRPDVNNFDDSDSSDNEDYSDDDDDPDPRDEQSQSLAEVHALLPPPAEAAGMDRQDLRAAVPRHNGGAEGGCID